MSNHPHIAILILAAGSSSRLGQPKQLVKINGKPLLEKVIQVALETRHQPVVVVLGAFYDQIFPFINHLPVAVTENKNWEKGMGSSIATGMEYLNKTHPDTDAVVLLVCDQYHLSETTIEQLVYTWKESGKKIIASRYGNATGVPALFSKTLFPELSNLQEKGGAKKIIRRYKEDVACINFAKGIHDLDTSEDLKRLSDQ